MISLETINTISISGYALAVAVHVIGLVLLFKSRGDLPNQRLITINLAASEMMMCLWAVIVYGRALCSIQMSDAFFYASFFGQFTLYTNIRFVMLHMIIDRFLYIWLNLKYAIYVTEKNLFKIIVTYWCVSMAIGLILTLSVKYIIDDSLFVPAYVILALDIFIVISAVTTYVYLFWKVRILARGPTNHSTIPIPSVVWLKLKIPTLMNLTFIAFNGIGSIIRSITLFSSSGVSLLLARRILDLFGWLSDAVIYIFLQKCVRDLLVSWFKKPSVVISPIEMNQL